MKPVYEKDEIQIYQGDCLEVMKNLPDNSIDTIITDPPYSLSSIKKRFGKTSLDDDTKTSERGRNRADGYARFSRGFMGKEWDNEIAFNSKVWRECLRVAKPGAFLLAFGGTRTFHRLMVAIEDAGWEIRDCIMWIYGVGFPKSLDIGKAIDKAKGAEREVVGVDESRYSRLINQIDGKTTGIWETGPREVNITTPSTPLAQTFDGYGTALKPSYEPIIWAQKPLNVVPNYGIITETNNLLGVMLCLLLSSVSDAEKILRLSQAELKEEMSVSVAMLVALLDGEKSGDLLEKMDMFSSRETVSMCLNIAKLWNNILSAVLSQGSKCTIKTETEVITILGILKSLILPIIPEYITRGASQANGLRPNADNAGSHLTEEKMKSRDILKHFVAEVVSWKTGESGTLANIAAKSLQLITPSVYTVLQSVIIHPEENDQINPSYEPIVIAMKPLDGTFANNAEVWGLAGLNIDGGRVLIEDDINQQALQKNFNSMGYNGASETSGIPTYSPKGRWPANVIHDGSDEVQAEFDKAGVRKSGAIDKRGMAFKQSSTFLANERSINYKLYKSQGSASRFFYTAKASPSERAQGNNHPTVKPLSLLRYLCKLTKTPYGGVILDPFMGSGTTLLAARAENREAIGIDITPEYCEIAANRLNGEIDVSPNDNRPEPEDRQPKQQRLF